MERATIHEIVSAKNKHLERAAIQTAEQIINQIADQQHVVLVATDKITALRKELNDLEIQQVSAKQILGEE